MTLDPDHAWRSIEKFRRLHADCTGVIQADAGVQRRFCADVVDLREAWGSRVLLARRDDRPVAGRPGILRGYDAIAAMPAPMPEGKTA